MCCVHFPRAPFPLSRQTGFRLCVFELNEKHMFVRNLRPKIQTAFGQPDSTTITKTMVLKNMCLSNLTFFILSEHQIPFAVTKTVFPKRHTKTLSQNLLFLYGFRTLDSICAYKNHGFENHVFVKPYVFHTF